ncbi:MAG: T9SS type A sorting domain-containing protein [Chitinophagaceae bacterium]|nr:T9SS type A sorting domain-containing protein [Chitinophagaceae bacterium]MCB9045509.1 T9SS type A sorting domain-containing protein [Chitinophagales bacterium]
MKINRYSLFPKAFLLGLVLLISGFNASAQMPPLTACSPSLIPYFGIGCSTGASIRSVVTTGGIVNFNNSNTNCANSSTSYSDYTTESFYVKQEAFKSFNVAITWNGNSSQNIVSSLDKVFIDWNRDGDFDDQDEYISPGPIQGTHPHAHQTANSTITVKVDVPGHAKEGITRMRVITSSLGVIYDPGVTACQGSRGEAEDYRVEVVNPCLPPNVISVANLDYKSADFAWTPKLNAEFYEYVITPVDTIPHDTVVGFTFTTTPSVDVDTFQCDTKYYIMVRLICDSARKIARDWKKSEWVRDSFTTQPCCYTPQVKVDKISSTTARVQWDPIATALGYEYAVSTTTDPPQKGTFTTSTSVVLQGLASKTTFFVHVRSRCTPTPLSGWAKSGFKTLGPLSVNTLSQTGLFVMDAYPNPMQDNLTVQFNGQIGNNARLTLIDLTGKVVYNAPVYSDKVTIDAAELPSGIYIVKYTDDVHNQVMRVTKK